MIDDPVTLASYSRRNVGGLEKEGEERWRGERGSGVYNLTNVLVSNYMNTLVIRQGGSRGGL